MAVNGWCVPRASDRGCALAFQERLRRGHAPAGIGQRQAALGAWQMMIGINAGLRGAGCPSDI
ncbi:hypothetical protein [Pseudorhodobacter wandonensis]|uniref:hypothetical protein n=1 Tax=Pseudorhodobacter wandonensis TaxID=1120568 RepID=UPI001E49F32B|nr:hypothetical protein [Pseudorhodobacter wandonensis]